MRNHRLKHKFNAGELSPLIYAHTDFPRYKDGCKKLYNMTCLTQGPATRRPGFRFVYDLVDIGLDTSNPQVRMIPFIYDKETAYVLIFFRHTDTTVKMVIGTGIGLLTFSGNGGPNLTECPPGTPLAPLPTVGDIISVQMPTGWDIEEFDWAQSADEMVIAQSPLAPYAIKRYSVECWTVELVTFVSTPVDWSDVNGWPEKVTFHQQRLVFAANLVRRQTVWLSQAGDFFNFTEVADDDASAIVFTLDSGTQNKIQWMISAKALNIGTLGNEWTVTGSTQFALTPANILAQRQTNKGGESNKPLMVGITTLFVERHGRVINEFVYDYSFDSYTTSDLAILSTHVTDLHSIVDWTYQQTPDSIVWAIRADGALLGMTYQREHKVVGWHQHDTQGAFKAITSIPGNTREDDVWTTVYRNIDSTDHYFVEVMADQFLAESGEWSRFMDAFSEYIGSPLDVISGLDYLDNETVQVLVDGAVHPDVTVTGGSITLNNAYSNVVVGLPFISEVQPIIRDIVTPEGTSVGRMQRVTNIEIDFYRSLGVYIGRYDSEDGEIIEERAFRVPGNLMDQAVPLYSGIRHLDFPEGYDRVADYFIRQVQPLPLTVRGVVDVVETAE